MKALGTFFLALFLVSVSVPATAQAYQPPTCTGVFDDVACPSMFADWIEQLYAEGITAGCGDGIFCPDSSTTRGQMAVFLLKVEHLTFAGSATLEETISGAGATGGCSRTIDPIVVDPFYVVVSYQGEGTHGAPARPVLWTETDTEAGTFTVHGACESSFSYMGKVVSGGSSSGD